MHNNEKVVEYEVVTDFFVTQAGEKYYSIRYEPNFLTPTLFIEKEPFPLGEKLKWHDHLVLFLMSIAIVSFPGIIKESIGSGIAIFIWPIIYFPARYIGLSLSAWKRTLI